VIPEGDETPRQGPTRARERDLLAERRARRAGAGDPELVRRAESAEVRVDALEAHLVDLRRRLAEAVRERERATELLVAHEHELRRVKQREYAEQQLRVEAEDNLTGLRREHRVELDRLHRRVQEAWAAERQAEEQRAAAEQQRAVTEQRRAALAARLAGVQESSVKLQHSVTALQDAATALRATLGREREAARVRIAELEHALRSAGRSEPEQTEQQAQRRDEMAEALAAAVERLRARVAAVGELQERSTDASSTPPADAPPEPEDTAVLVPPVLSAPVVERSPHRHSMSLIARVRIRRKHRRERQSTAAQPPTMQSQ
jgi:chromosome segregation ATPase